MKPKFFFICLFLFFYGLTYSILPKEKIKSIRVYLVNPNGLAVLKSKISSNEKSGIIRYREEVALSFLEAEKWVKLETKKISGFLPKEYLHEDDFVALKKIDKQVFGSVSGKETPLYSLPTVDSKKIGRIASSSIIELISFSDKVFEESPNKNQSLWYEIQTEKKEMGFIRDKLKIYSTKEEAIKSVKYNKVSISGYFLITTNPNYLENPEEFENANTIEDKGKSRKGEFIQVVESIEVKGSKYYKVQMENSRREYKMQSTPKNFNDSPFVAWISGKEGIYFTNKQFSQYTIKKSSFGRNKQVLLKILEQNKDIPLNFTNFSLEKLPSNSASVKSNFYIARLAEGYLNSAQYGNFNFLLFIIEKKGNEYISFSGNIMNRGRIDMYDLDKDGIPEFLTKMSTDDFARVAFAAPAFYGFINGAYKEIPLPGNFLDKYEIRGNTLHITKQDDFGSKVKVLKYKYKKGKFFKIRK